MDVEVVARLHAEAVIIRETLLEQALTGEDRRKAMDVANSRVWAAERQLADAVGLAGSTPVDRTAHTAAEPSESWWLVQIGRDALARLIPEPSRPSAQATRPFITCGPEIESGPRMP